MTDFVGGTPEGDIRLCGGGQWGGHITYGGGTSVMYQSEHFWRSSKNVHGFCVKMVKNGLSVDKLGDF